MDQLAGAVADDMHAEQLAGLAVENQLQQASHVADDLAAGDLLIVGLADLIGDADLGQLLLGLTDHRDLGNRIDAVGEQRRNAVRLDAEVMANRQPALFH